LDELRVKDDKNHQNFNVITTLKEKIEFYQEENVRLSNELFETKKKFDISKSEIEKYEKEKSNLISKMNSVNEAINNSNILTNVFENKVKPKINIIDHNIINKEEKKKDLSLNEMVKNIFSKK
jgi:predicted nuclease with TOPRIM domain